MKAGLIAAQRRKNWWVSPGAIPLYAQFYEDWISGLQVTGPKSRLNAHPQPQNDTILGQCSPLLLAWPGNLPHGCGWQTLDTDGNTIYRKSPYSCPALSTGPTSSVAAGAAYQTHPSCNDYRISGQGPAPCPGVTCLVVGSAQARPPLHPMSTGHMALRDISKKTCKCLRTSTSKNNNSTLQSGQSVMW